mgnify:CR=1 FL=1
MKRTKVHAFCVHTISTNNNFITECAENPQKSRQNYLNNMKKTILCVAMAMCALAVNARTWRINYDENSSADFRTLAQACANANVHDGDVFYMEPGYHYGSESDNTVTRRCTIVGPGWGFNTKAGEEIEVSTTHFTSSINIQHDSVHVIGLNAGQIYIYKSGESLSNPLKNVTIERCKVISISISNYTYGINIRNNFFYSRYYNYSCLSLSSYFNYGVVEGNIILGRVSFPGASGVGSRFDHNTLIYYYSSSDYCITYATRTTMIITNNIIIKTSSNYTQNVCDFANGVVNNYNVYSITPAQYAEETATGSTKYSDHPTNQYIGATVENTFINDVEGLFFDEAMRYQVLEGSVAKTAASDGGECGAFGGSHPYVLCGRPTGIPYLYDVDVPEHTTNNTLTISFKVAGQNE